MKKGYLILIAALVMAAGLTFILSSWRFGQKERKAVPETRVSSVEQASTAEKTKNAQPQDAATEEEEEEAPAVEIPSEKRQMIGVKTTEVAVRPLSAVIRTVGMVDYDERSLSTVNAKFEGWIEKLYVDYNGRYVKKGEPLAEIYSPELLATQREFLNVLKWAKRRNTPPTAAPRRDEDIPGGADVSDMIAKDADVLVEAAKQRLRLWDISEALIRKIEESGKPVRALTLYSPTGGYVIQKTALQGMKAAAGERLFDLADLSTVWIIADVYESDLALVKPGERAMISLSYFPGRKYPSRIGYIYPYVSGQSRTVKVRFEIPNYEGRLKPQMYTNVEVNIDLGRKLSVPDDAVIDTGTRQIVYVDRGGENFEPREVLLGIRAEGMREVVKGLTAGEKVVSSATFLIDSEAQMKNVAPLKSGSK